MAFKKKQSGMDMLKNAATQMSNPMKAKKGGKKRSTKRAMKLGAARQPMIGADLGGAGPTEMAARGDRPNVGDWAFNKGGKYAKKGKKAKSARKAKTAKKAAKKDAC